MSLHLGIQTNKGNTNKEAIRLAKRWAPTSAKSFTIESLIHTNYNGSPQKEETGYAKIVVSYFSTEKEGTTLC